MINRKNKMNFWFLKYQSSRRKSKINANHLEVCCILEVNDFSFLLSFLITIYDCTASRRNPSELSKINTTQKELHNLNETEIIRRSSRIASKVHFQPIRGNLYAFWNTILISWYRQNWNQVMFHKMENQIVVFKIALTSFHPVILLQKYDVPVK